VRTVLLLLCAETTVSVFYSLLPSLVSLHSLSLLFLYFWTMMVLSVVAGRNNGGAGGGATVALLLPLLSCSFTLLSPFSSFFFCFARAPFLSNKLSPSFSLLPSSVFIAAGREGHLTTAMSWHRVGWLVMACINGGRVWDVACVFGQVRRARQIA